jgi:putative ABC transport system substrate-binding protein
LSGGTKDVDGRDKPGHDAADGSRLQTARVRRREFIALLGAAAAPALLAGPAARAQQPALPVIGFLGVGRAGEYADQLRGFHRGLSEAGFVEGRNLAIEYRWAGRQYDRLPALAADLVRRQVRVIALSGLPAALAAKAATATIPIVFQMGVDPVKVGLVASLSRPGGNLTGVSNLNAELGPKRLELLHELVPAATVVALLVNPVNPNAEPQSKELAAAARALGLQIHVLHASTEGDFDAVFARMVELRAGALVVGIDGLFIRLGAQLGALSVRHRVPAIFRSREFAAAGGVLSYGASLMDATFVVGVYTGRILKGEKPADLPVQQATKVELIINLKTAKALGLRVSLPLLGRADEVIE